MTNAKSHCFLLAQVIVCEGVTRCEEMYVLLKEGCCGSHGRRRTLRLSFLCTQTSKEANR
eukprot:10665250-Prorocentrum_lima.AAC.1